MNINRWKGRPGGKFVVKSLDEETFPYRYVDSKIEKWWFEANRLPTRLLILIKVRLRRQPDQPSPLSVPTVVTA